MDDIDRELNAIDHELAHLMPSLYEGEGLADYILRISPHLPPPRHIMPFIAKLEESRVRPVRLLISWPPRHAKTTTIIHAINWLLER